MLSPRGGGEAGQYVGHLTFTKKIVQKRDPWAQTCNQISENVPSLGKRFSNT